MADMPKIGDRITLEQAKTLFPERFDTGGGEPPIFFVASRGGEDFFMQRERDGRYARLGLPDNDDEES